MPNSLRSWTSFVVGAVACVAASVCGCQATPPRGPARPARPDGAEAARPAAEAARPRPAAALAPAPAPAPVPAKAAVAIEQPTEPIAWTALECPEKDRGAAEYFVPGEVIESFDAGLGGWAAAAGSQQARATLALDTVEKHAGAASLRVEFEFTGDKNLEYVNFGRELAIPAKGAGLGMMVRTDGTKLTYRLRIVDSSGETHQLDFAGSPSPAWSLVAIMYDSPSGSWGGDGNRTLDYPCRLQSIVADRPSSGYRGTGKLWIDTLTGVSRRTFAQKLFVEIGDRRFGNVYEPGERLFVRARTGEGLVGWRLEDYAGATLVSSAAVSNASSAFVRLDRPGYYRVAFERTTGGGAIDETRYAACAVLEKSREDVRNDFVGFCSHFRGNSYPLECMALMRRYGLRHFRDEASWDGFEPRPKEYRLPEYCTTFLRRAKELEMHPLMILDYGNRNYDGGGYPNSAEAIAAYAAHGVEFVRQAGDAVKDVEIWNEWIGGCGMSGKGGEHTPETYGRLLKPAYEALKRAHPALRVVGMGGFCVRPFPEMVERAISTSGPLAMDALSIHPYRYPRAPEESDLVGEMTSVADKAASLGAPKKIWVTEIGWPTFVGSRGVDERTEARYIVRTMALLQTTGFVERVYWYDFKNDGTNREYNEDNFGVVHHQKLNCAPKPAVVAASVFARMTERARPVGLTKTGDLCAARYRGADGTDLVVAWRTGAPAATSFAGTVEAAYDAMGARVAPAPTLEVGPDPVYVVGRGLVLAGE